ncbi:hypothetical protein [Sulfurimonas sp.]|uniref:hypothetical protein n=1 Tax=Sulfurimonas sp. TaxID=2022749 RepID=UPI00286DEF8B|nr:hypothetical protein [Sulfurimonas sp.]
MNKLLLLLLFLSNYAYGSTEFVMYEGVSIKVKKNNSSVEVIAGKGFDRIYKWDNCELESDMVARKKRWYGSLGIYDPAPSFFPFFGGCQGISRTVVEEGQIHFDDLQFAHIWIERQLRRKVETVWTNDGLFVSWNIVPGRAQLNVDVHLICINGKRPIHLDGATDSSIIVSQNKSGQSIQECVSVGQDVIDQTRTQLEENWKEIDGWIAQDKKYRERKQLQKQ